MVRTSRVIVSGLFVSSTHSIRAALLLGFLTLNETLMMSGSAAVDCCPSTDQESAIT